MIFEVTPKHIQDLDSTRLVQLMKRLLLAECRLAGIPMRAAIVPLQITVPDGGEDGRIEWEGGKESTNYFLSRFCLFQSKAQALSKKRIVDEILKKPIGKGKKKLILSDAISEVLSKHGAYIFFSSHPLTGQKIETFRKDALAAIKRGGGKGEIKVDIFDANRITEWVNSHPAIALWLSSGIRLRSVSGFQSYDGWSRANDIKIVNWVDDGKARFVPSNFSIPEKDRKDKARNAWTFEQAAGAVATHLANDSGRIVRIIGPSGFGKTRFANSIFSRSTSIADDIDRAAIIYADYTITGEETAKFALDLADQEWEGVLVIDECPDAVHIKIADLLRRVGSRFCLVTLDVETRVIQADKTLVVSLEPASADLISGIAKNIAPTLNDVDARFIQDFSVGFPKMAVLAAQHDGKVRETINSVEQIVERVLWGTKAPDKEAERALELLSLFDWVGFSGRVQDQITFIASELASMKPDLFIEHIKSFQTRGIISQRGDFVQVQPIPLATRLGIRRLELLPSGKLAGFFSAAPKHVRMSLLKRIRWLDTSPAAKSFGAQLLSPECLGNLSSISTDFGAECIDRLTHIDPDLVMDTLDRVYGNLSAEELRAASGGRRHAVWALEKLAFRARTFIRAASLLRKLASVETEERIANNASGQFKGLFQLYLSGTEAIPKDRLIVLDEGLKSSNELERSLCIDALDNMLESNHFTRSGGAEEIGSGERLQDWIPKTYGEIWNFYQESLNRLTPIAASDDAYASKARNILSSNIRGLIGRMPFEPIQAMIERVVAHQGFWPEAIQGLNSWLYFDRQKSDKALGPLVRKLFDQLMPTDPVTLVVLYTHGWQMDFHNPDKSYDQKDTQERDWEYSTNKSIELADVIARDKTQIDSAVSKLAIGDAKTVFGFSRRLAELVDDPVELFSQAVESAENSSQLANRQFFAGLIAGTDQRDPAQARKCIQQALRSPILKGEAITLIGSGKLQPSDLTMVISLLESGEVQPWQCVTLSYGRGLDHLTDAEILPLLEALQRKGAEGLWSILDIVSMYLHGGKIPSPLIIAKLKDVILSPALFEKINRRTMDGYHLEETFSWLNKSGAIDNKFAALLVRQLLNVTKGVKSDVFFELDSPIRKIFASMLKTHPRELWTELSNALLENEKLESFYLVRLIDSDRYDHLGPGVMYGLPKEIYLEWVRKDPNKRAEIILDWLPITNKSKSGDLVWHPDLESFVSEFGGQNKVLGSLSIRLHPRSWAGSKVPLIEPFVSLLESWSNHPKPEVRQWAIRQLAFIREQITSERKRDDERDVGLY